MFFRKNIKRIGGQPFQADGEVHVIGEGRSNALKSDGKQTTIEFSVLRTVDQEYVNLRLEAEAIIKSVKNCRLWSEEIQPDKILFSAFPVAVCHLRSISMFFAKCNKSICGRIVCRNCFVVLEFWKQHPSQLFSEFHSHLIIGIDIPNDPLHENLVFIKSKKRTERLRCQLLKEKGIRRSVARKNF
jgi:hypothetical protein